MNHIGHITHIKNNLKRAGVTYFFFYKFAKVLEQAKPIREVNTYTSSDCSPATVKQPC